MIGALNAVVHDSMTVVAGGPFESDVAVSGAGGVGRGGAAEPVGPQGGAVFDREEVVARDPAPPL